MSLAKEIAMKNPRVFIGSASESLDIAQQVKDVLARDFECYLWTDEVFKSNDSIFQTLLTEAGLFDFGILVLAKDDYKSSRGVTTFAPRDNMLFEFGMFLGRVGSDRAFALVEDGTGLPTDLLGIQLEKFSRSAKEGYLDIRACTEKISKRMRESDRLGYLSMFPTTAMAIGYFNNFVTLVAEGIASSPQVDMGGVQYSVDGLAIVMPENLDADIKKRATIYYESHGLKQIELPTRHRSHPLYAVADDKAKKLMVYDMPTVLDGIDKAIDMYLRKGAIGKSTAQQLLEDRELRNFEKVLSMQIGQDAFCKKFVTIIKE